MGNKLSKDRHHLPPSESEPAKKFAGRTYYQGRQYEKIIMLKGKKTYILSAASVVWAVAGVTLGNLTVEQAVPYLLAGLMAFSLRNAIK